MIDRPFFVYALSCVNCAPAVQSWREPGSLLQLPKQGQYKGWRNK
jgi:hypothetical protein